MTNLQSYIAIFCVLLLILPIHEVAHGYVAMKNGDYTAKCMGRLTLNPAKHFDLLGILSFLLVGFGWAKPVPINPYNFRNLKKGLFQVSIAGVIANYILAFLFYPLYLLALYTFSMFQMPVVLLGVCKFVIMVLYYGFRLDLSFFVFNLLPFYPLDGFRVIDALTKKRGNKVFLFLRDRGRQLLLALIVLSFIAEKIPRLFFLDIFGYFMNFAVNIVGYPITAFWNFIFNLIF